MSSDNSKPGSRRLFRNARAEWRLSHYAPGERMAAHRHSCAQFSVTLAGRHREITKSGELDAHGFIMEAKPAHFQHANEYGPEGALLLSINLFAIDEEDRELALEVWRARPAGAVHREWRTLTRELIGPKGPSETRVNDLTDDLLAALLIDAEDVAPGAAPPAWLQRVYQALIETDLTADALAREAGVHRVHLARSFRRHYGVSPSVFRRRARLARAADAIARDGASLATAAHMAGFADQAHMTRDMGRETGLTPGALAQLFAAA